MTVNRTTLLDLPLPVTGTESGTWGDTTNNGLTQYLDIAIAGTLVLSTDADVTLTSTEGDSSATNIGATTAQYAILRWTATGSTTRNITALAQSKTYVVINATGGTQSIVLRGAGPTTGVTIISGEKAHCVWNGSDFVKVSSSAAAGGSNTQVQYNSSGVLAGSSNMTFDGTSLSLKASPNLIFESGGNERGRIVTGTGAFELMAGSTVTPTISLASSVATFTNNPVLSGGTANGVLYLNGSKVATSGSALTFDGTLLTRTRPADYSTRFAYDASNYTDIGYFSTNTVAPSNPFWIWYLNGSEQMRLTSTGLGIGTSSPLVKFDVKGTTDTHVGITANGIDEAIILAYDDGGIRTPNLSYGAASHKFLIDTTERMRLDSSGNLGLGVTPSAWGNEFAAMQYGFSGAVASYKAGTTAEFMHVVSNAYNDNTNWRYIRDGAATRYEQNESVHKWFTSASGTAGNTISFTQAMTLDASGNLSIGTTTVGVFSRNIDLDGSSSSGIQLRVGNAGKAFFYADTSDAYVGANSGAVIFKPADTERARITSGGDLLVGTMSQFDAERISVTAATTQRAAYLKNDTAATTNTLVHNSATSGDNAFIGFGTEGTYTARGSITYNRGGGLVAYNTTSDYRAKDIIGPLTDSGAVIDALKVYEGVMKGATQSRPMLIAHEAQEVAPYAVTGEKDAVNKDGTPKYQQMDVSSLVPLLLAEIQSLRQRVALLEGN